LPKATWGTGNDALTAGDIDNAERSQQYAPYDGPIPPSGLYRFVIKFIKKGESQSGNPKAQILLELDGSWKPKHKQYDGCPLWDNMPVMKSTGWRVAAFCDAIGATSKDFLSGMIVDEDKKVTKIGKVGDPTGLLVYVNAKHEQAADGYGEQLRLNGAGYVPLDEAPEDEGDEDQSSPSDDEGDGEEPPF
jgi:hypothetical protein